MATGAIVQFRLVNGFDTLSEADAGEIIYGKLIPECERQGVRFSKQGNTTTFWDAKDVNRCDLDNATYELFNVKRIQQAFRAVVSIIKAQGTGDVDSFYLRSLMDDFQGAHIGHVDMIVAMLLNGHAARFGEQGEEGVYMCRFNVEPAFTEEERRQLRINRQLSQPLLGRREDGC